MQRTMSNTPLKKEISVILGFIACLWGVWLADLLLPGSFNDWGITPRTIGGLPGILLSPFLHQGILHLISNTIPLAVLLVLLAGSRSHGEVTAVAIALLGGALLWLFGRPSTHIGASLLVYGLISYLIVSGFLERKMLLMAVSLLVLFLYGGTLLFGMIPSLRSHVSWEGHLLGAVAGVVVAYLQHRPADKKSNDLLQTPEV
jgi:membrane associated rhomboid family serine protease